ncbi:hypothetical protein U1Q18_007713 [Sarracenia purpurea var. burkii]
MLAEYVTTFFLELVSPRLKALHCNSSCSKNSLGYGIDKPLQYIPNIDLLKEYPLKWGNKRSQSKGSWHHGNLFIEENGLSSRKKGFLQEKRLTSCLL